MILKKKIKVAKIIATSFYKRSFREKTGLSGDPPVYHLHSQNFRTDESIKNLIQFNIDKENECDPGIPIDLIIVNNDIGNISGNKFIENLNNTKTKHGKVITVQNNNNGWSYGAYNKGFELYKNQYDYFIFAEDDVIIAKDNYATIGLDILRKNKKCGFVSFCGISYSHEFLKKKDAIHAHGASGMTSTKILNKIYEKYGKLPHSKNSDKKYYDEIILEGEIKFTNVIYKMGYELIEPPKNNKLFEPAYDLMRGIKKPWKPGYFKKNIWLLNKKLRKKTFDFLVFLKIYRFYRNIFKK
ncbi:glycosyltransferase family 2 protein [Pelagibacteraceae bacterium]|nr:glycosyltransferase family 2 protein [Pelagibacteraceae bacterium]